MPFNFIFGISRIVLTTNNNKNKKIMSPIMLNQLLQKSFCPQNRDGPVDDKDKNLKKIVLSTGKPVVILKWMFPKSKTIE